MRRETSIGSASKPSDSNNPRLLHAPTKNTGLASTTESTVRRAIHRSRLLGTGERLSTSRGQPRHAHRRMQVQSRDPVLIESNSTSTGHHPSLANEDCSDGEIDPLGSRLGTP